MKRVGRMKLQSDLKVFGERRIEQSIRFGPFRVSRRKLRFRVFENMVIVDHQSERVREANRLHPRNFPDHVVRAIESPVENRHAIKRARDNPQLVSLERLERRGTLDTRLHGDRIKVRPQRGVEFDLNRFLRGRGEVTQWKDLFRLAGNANGEAGARLRLRLQVANAVAQPRRRFHPPEDMPIAFQSGDHGAELQRCRRQSDFVDHGGHARIVAAQPIPDRQRMAAGSHSPPPFEQSLAALRPILKEANPAPPIVRHRQVRPDAGGQSDRLRQCGVRTVAKPKRQPQMQVALPTGPFEQPLEIRVGDVPFVDQIAVGDCFELGRRFEPQFQRERAARGEMRSKFDHQRMTRVAGREAQERLDPAAEPTLDRFGTQQFPRLAIRRRISRRGFR